MEVSHREIFHKLGSAYVNETDMSHMCVGSNSLPASPYSIISLIGAGEKE